MRKQYLDNIRWITIIIVVIFHIFFYYNNIGIEAMFAGAKEFNGNITFAGLFQYIVYPWFMTLLFVVSGMSARYALKKRTTKQFIRSRVDKLLVPSTLGVLAFGWIGGLVVYLHNASVGMPEGMPAFVGVAITFCSGIGPLWFCHVLFIASLVLVLIRIIVGKFHKTDDDICKWFAHKASTYLGVLIMAVVMYLILWGGSHILNMPRITSYRNGIYIPAFILGFYIFSNDAFIDKLKKMAWITGILAVVAGVFYITRCYGMDYTASSTLARWDVNLYTFFIVLFALGIGARFLERGNSFTEYMKKCSFGIFVLHIPVMLVTNYILDGRNLPMAAVYIIELVSGVGVSILLYELIRRIPVIRYWILGIRKKKYLN